MTASGPGVDRWLPPPEAWPRVVCGRCEAAMRVPFAPSDGLCAECRTVAEAPAERTVEELLAEAGAPPKYAAFTRSSWERRYGAWQGHALLSRLIGWPYEGLAEWLLFITSRGHGDRKTGLATAVLGEALARGARGKWISQSGWLRDLKASWNGGDAAPEHVVWSGAADAELLLFDDLGGVEGLRESGKPWWRQQVTQLLHHREAHALPTIVTARLADWREVRRIHESLVPRMDVPLKIALPSGPGRARALTSGSR